MIKAQRGTKDIFGDEILTWQWILKNAQNVINTVYSYLEKTDYSTIVENNVSNNAQDASTKIKSYFGPSF